MRSVSRLALSLATALAFAGAPHAPDAPSAAHAQERQPAATLDALQTQLASPDIDARIRAVQALPAHGAAAVPLLARALGDRSVHVRRVATLALASVAPPTDASLAALVRALGDEDQAVQDNATWALRTLGARALPAVTAAMRDPDAHVRLAATGIVATSLALGRMERVPDETLAALVTALADPSADVRATAARALGEAGPAASAAIPGLRKIASGDPFDYVRSAATHAIPKIDAR